jgi:hypothetical protein
MMSSGKYVVRQVRDGTFHVRRRAVQDWSMAKTMSPDEAREAEARERQAKAGAK